LWLAEAEAAVATLKLPAGVRLAFTGQIEHMRETRDRLQVVVPLALLVIVLLLFAATRSGAYSWRRSSRRRAAATRRRCSSRASP
jgi:Cu/Ag efflux pump CusA